MKSFCTSTQKVLKTQQKANLVFFYKIYFSVFKRVNQHVIKKWTE